MMARARLAPIDLPDFGMPDARPNIPAYLPSFCSGRSGR